MSLFRRRRPQAVPEATAGAAWPGGVAVAPIRTAAAGATAPAGQVQGWAGLGVQLPPSYAGAYSGTPVSMRGGMEAGLQRQGGTEGLCAAWTVPATTMPQTTLGNSWAATQRASNHPGAQRVGGAPSGGLGPSNVRAMRGAVTAAQIRQSGLAAVQWAQSLTPVVGR